MKRNRWPGLVLAGAGLALTALSGCQTWVAGMTLPSPRYLQHPPQYIQDSPPFPLSRELASMQMAGAPVSSLAVPAPLPAPLVPPPLPVLPPVNPAVAVPIPR